MKSINESITEAYLSIYEMAAPTTDIKNMTFYHGTHNMDAAHAIMGNGIKTSDKASKSSLTPVLGAAYVTPDIGYAQIYALGGDTAGHPHRQSDIERHGQYGHVFKISGKNLSDVQPDEDSVGEMVGMRKGPLWLHGMADRHVSSGTLAKARSGEYTAFARIGKNLVKKMSDNQKIDLIVNHGAHVANIGKITPDEGYRIDKTKQHLLKRDGSNFFQHAEKVYDTKETK